MYFCSFVFATSEVLHPVAKTS